MAKFTHIYDLKKKERKKNLSANKTTVLHHTQKLNSKYAKDFNVRPEAIKDLKENIGGKFLDSSLGNNFLDLTSKAKATKTKTKN